MTTTTDAGTTPDPAADGTLPRYKSGEVPDHLLSETRLRARRLRPAEGQRPVAYTTSRYVPRVMLYDVAQAVPLQPLSARQRAAYEARRTCQMCNTVQADVLGTRWAPWLPAQRGQLCDPCARAATDRHERTCAECRTTFQDPHSAHFGGTCDACRDRLQRAREVVDRLLLRHCPDCTTPTASRAEVEAVQAADQHGVAWDYPRMCERCARARRRAATQARRREELARWKELGPIRQWARDILARPELYAVLDVETTGLEGDVRTVQVAVTTGGGRVLLDTLVQPGIPIPAEASAVHGITDDDVREAPEFGAILPTLTKALRGRRIVIYNAAYDTGVLAGELDRHHRHQAPTLDGTDLRYDEVHPAAAEWMDAQQWDRCAMEAYAVHVGEWSEYFGGWRWHRLNGGHSAAGDCLAVVDRIREIAEAPDPY